MKHALFAILFSFLVPISFADHPSEAFDSYKDAILSQDGDSAANRVSASTISQYDDYLRWARTLDKDGLKELSFINRFQVIIMKHRLPKNLLLSGSGRDAFVYAVNHDWIGKSGVVPMSADNYHISGDRAISDASHAGQMLPYKFQYIKEGGVWKYDLTIIMKISNEPLRQAAIRSGLTEDEFIFKLTEAISGKKVPDSIWEPIKG